jgi:GLPGLI family protein
MKLLQTIFCFAYFVLPAIAQENTNDAIIRCYYRFTQKKKIVDKEIILQDTLTLDIGSQMSRYYDERKIQRDSIFSGILSNLDASRIKSISILKDQEEGSFQNMLGDTYQNDTYDGISEQIFKNRKTGNITMLNYISTEHYKGTDPGGVLDWSIMPDTAVFLNYPCQKATLRFRGRNYEAWFTPQISINDGPWKFFGLPGLILKVKDIDGQFDFECIDLEHLNTAYNIEIPEYKYYECNRKEYNKVMSKKSSGNIININGGDITMISLKADSSIQPIELE